MRLEHRFSVPTSVEETWAAFNDLDRVVPCFPGATLTSVDGDEFVGSCKIKLGPVSLLYTGTGRFVERDQAAYRAVVVAKGKDRRGNGTASATVTARLTASGAASTEVAVETDLTVTGRPAQFGRGLIQDVSDKMLGQFAGCLAQELGPTPDASEDAEPAPRPAPRPAPGPAPRSGASPGEEDALDLGSALLPALARRLAPYVIGTAALVFVLRRLLRRR